MSNNNTINNSIIINLILILVKKFKLKIDNVTIYDLSSYLS